jgi:FtsH-binding integral membrane protein
MSQQSEGNDFRKMAIFGIIVCLVILGLFIWLLINYTKVVLGTIIVILGLIAFAGYLLCGGNRR